jgi:pimeloyl-ACP methyl ester carboxylesterase
VRVDVGGGTRLFVDVLGAGLVADGAAMREQPTIVFLHGGPGMDHSLFTSSRLTELGDVAQLVFYDHRGQGRSDGADPAGWTLDRWADDVLALCDALGIEAPIVYGASFGGMVAQRYLARHPEHPAAVVLACTSARLDLDVIAGAFERFGGPDVAAVARRFWGGDMEALFDYLERCMPLYSTTSGGDPDAIGRVVMNLDVMGHFIRTEQPTMDLRAGLAGARCPVLVISGELDPVCPVEAGREIADALPPDLVRFEVVAGASHAEVEGDASVDLVRRLLADLPS